VIKHQYLIHAGAVKKQQNLEWQNIST